jgi:hypothetical protein
VLDEKQLAKGGFGGILGVGQGSSHPPRLLKISYTPSRAGRKGGHLALVGKGITFDSGGLSIKPNEGMTTMKCDMSGAAAVVAATLALARNKADVRVTAYACLAENMPSGTAIRPSDVLTMYGGKTVEVLNTDAEGRLVLADGIVRASEESPDLIVDVATLTGACVVALGERTSGVMSTDDAARTEVAEAAPRFGAPGRRSAAGRLSGRAPATTVAVRGSGRRSDCGQSWRWVVTDGDRSQAPLRAATPRATRGTEKWPRSEAATGPLLGLSAVPAFDHRGADLATTTGSQMTGGHPGCHRRVAADR